MKKIYTFVTGDLFHANHLKFLQNCRALGDYLVVGIVPDKEVQKYKRKPIIPEKERTEIVRALKCVDEIVVHNVFSPLKALRIVKPDVIVHGNDWKKMPFEGEIRKMGIEIIYSKYLKGVTTTKIINKILKERKITVKKEGGKIFC